MPWWNMHNYYNWWNSESFWPGQFLFSPLIVPVVLWSLVWKGIALYRAARNEQKGWFVLLLVVNAMGILEIVYLLLFSKQTKTPKTTLRTKKSS